MLTFASVPVAVLPVSNPSLFKIPVSPVTESAALLPVAAVWIENCPVSSLNLAVTLPSVPFFIESTRSWIVDESVTVISKDEPFKVKE